MHAHRLIHGRSLTRKIGCFNYRLGDRRYVRTESSLKNKRYPFWFQITNSISLFKVTIKNVLRRKQTPDLTVDFNREVMLFRASRTYPRACPTAICNFLFILLVGRCVYSPRTERYIFSFSFHRVR